MSFKSAIPLLLLMAFAAVVAAGQPRAEQVASASDYAFQHGDAAGDELGVPAEPETVLVPADLFDDAPRIPIVPDISTLPLTSDQEDCQKVGGIARLDSESFDGRSFPLRGGAWTVSDLHGARPGFLDDVMWGQADCEATVGLKSLWSVGGGRIGANLSCEAKEYYTEQRAGRGGIRTLLRYGPLNLTAGNPVGPRVTFDYKAKMPEGALLVGIADGSVRDEGEAVQYTGWSNFTADTGGDWIRGDAVAYDIRREFDEIFAGFERKDQVEIGFFYRDPAPDPSVGPPTAGMYGAFIDNVHIDVKYVARPCRIPSPTSVEQPTFTPTPTPIDTVGPTVTKAPTVKLPTPRPSATLGPIMLPFLFGEYVAPVERTPIPTVPSETPSTTPTPSDTPTPTYTPTTPPTGTPTPPPTPTRTPRPSPTDVPVPKVILSYIQPFTLGAVDLEIAEISNIGTGPQDITEWRVFFKEKPAECYIEDSNKTVVLGPGESFEVRAGPDAEDGIREGDNGPVDGFACNTRNFIMDNNLDRVTLFDDFDTPVHRVCWDLEGFYPCWNTNP